MCNFLFSICAKLIYFHSYPCTCLALFKLTSFTNFLRPLRVNFCTIHKLEQHTRMVLAQTLLISASRLVLWRSGGHYNINTCIRPMLWQKYSKYYCDVICYFKVGWLTQLWALVVKEGESNQNQV